MAEETKVSADEIQTIVRASLEQARRFHEENLEPDMVKATDYYNGELFGDEKEGRSKVVSMDVHDVTLGQMPGLLRTFMGGEDAVEFAPEGPEDVELARQQTDFVNWIVREANPGFVELSAAFKDALVRRLGAWKWWYEVFSRVKGSVHRGVDQEGLMALFMDDDVVDLNIEETYFDQISGFELSNIRVTRKEERGRIRYQAVPPEELVFTPSARAIEVAPLVAHVRKVAREEIVALGVDEDVLEDAIAGEAAELGDDMENARTKFAGDLSEDDNEGDESQDEILFAEVYQLVDGDGDGIAECRMFQCIGETHTIVNGDGKGEVVDEVPFAVITPDLEPHTVVGRSNWDDHKEIQRVKSHILRGTLDSLRKSIDPDLVVRDGEVNPIDLNEGSGIIRTLGDPNLVLKEMAHQFAGHGTLPMLEYYDQVREDRSGWNRSSAALNPEALQSSTQQGVSAALTAGQARVEMIARAFAETGVKRLYQGLLNLAIRYQDRPSVIRLRGEWVTVDPRHWHSALDVRVNIGIGQGTREERLAFLGMLLQQQLELMKEGSPLVTWVEIRYTFGQILKLAGRQDADQYLRPWGQAEQKQLEEQMAQQPPQQDPATMLVEVEKQKAAMQAQMDQAKLVLDRLKIQLQDDRERDKIARESVLKEREIEAKFAVDIKDAELKAQVATNRAEMDADIKRQQAAQGGQNG